MSERIFGCPNTKPQHMMEKWESWEKGILVCECGKRFQLDGKSMKMTLIDTNDKETT